MQAEPDSRAASLTLKSVLLTPSCLQDSNDTLVVDLLAGKDVGMVLALRTD